MTSKFNTMTAAQFNTALARLDLTPYAAAELLGVSRSTAYRYARGDATISTSTALLLAMYLRHGIPSEWQQP
jgi:plasmid maintenance system antidote protein VapI